jgi:hypothetical protein
MMVGLAANVCFTPVGQPIVDERMLIGPYLCVAVGVCCTTLVMVRSRERYLLYACTYHMGSFCSSYIIMYACLCESRFATSAATP